MVEEEEYVGFQGEALRNPRKPQERDG